MYSYVYRIIHITGLLVGMTGLVEHCIVPFARSKLKSHNLNFPFVNNKLQLYFFVLLSLTFDSLNIKLSLLPGLPGPAGKQQETAS